MAAPIVRPNVFVASEAPERAAALARELPEARVVLVRDAEALLRETRTMTPDVLLLCGDLPSSVPLADLLVMLRARPELAYTHWLALGSTGLGALVSAGADAIVAESTPPAAVAMMVRTHLARVRQLRDLEERAHMQQQRLEDWAHEERVRDQLVHMLVHDLKNPISAVLGLMDVVLEDAGRVPDDLLELLRLARDESQHLLHLAVNMLDVRKMQAGKMHLSRATLFAASMRDVVELAQGDVGIGLSDRDLTVELPEGLSPVHADPELLRRVFANLISNAVKHTRQGGRIRVVASQEGGLLRWSVQDDGEGIPEEDLPNLFSAFEQSRLTLHGRFDTGMGLAFCKLAVDAHGGRIWVESTRGHGSVFSFELPLVREEDDEDEFVEMVQ
ncbi:sensor histidine kinase [Deinococcus pimensis]|uniref:ATP-binding protein n=1 Tax=Deinococcus pimensis TaxID=309888 RepID=UPI000488F271|nr:HAMP domain-containing sensor histidine kinase [Deinococcus pimensis]